VVDFGGTSFVFAKLQDWLRNTYQLKAERNTEKYARWITVRNTCTLLLDGWCLRLRDIHIKPPIIIRFSMLLSFLNCPTPLWNILSHLRIALSVNTTKRLMQIASQVSFPDRMEWMDHLSIAMVGADNMSYMTRASQVRVGIAPYTFVHTINMWQKWNDYDAFGIFTANDNLYKHIPNLDEVKQQLTLRETDMRVEMSSAFEYAKNEVNLGKSLLERPEGLPNGEPARLDFKVPLLNIGTAAYADIFRFLCHIRNEYIGKYRNYTQIKY